MSEALATKQRLISALYERQVLPFYGRHAGRLCLYLDRRGWSSLKPRINDLNLHSLAYEDFSDALLRYGEPELAQALEDGRDPNRTEYALESLYYIILQRRFIDVIREETRIGRMQQPWPTGDDEGSKGSASVCFWCLKLNPC